MQTKSSRQPVDSTKSIPFNLEWQLNLGLNYLTNNPDRLNCRPYFDVYFYDRMCFRGNKPTATHSCWDFGDVGARFIKAHIYTRKALGIIEPSEVELKIKDLLLTCFKEDGLIHRPFESYPGWNPEHEDMHMWDQGQTALCLSAWYESTGDEAVKITMDKLVEGLWNIAEKKADFMFFPKEAMKKGKWVDPKTGAQVCATGECIAGLANWAKITGNAMAMELASNLTRGLFQEYPFRIFNEDGSFAYQPKSTIAGLKFVHCHGRTQALIGMIQLAIIKNDSSEILRCKQILDWFLQYCSSFGWCPEHFPTGSGHWGEICTTVDVIEAAALLASTGYTEYWNVVERYVRNHLAETQITDIAPFEHLIQVDDKDGEPCYASSAKKGYYESSSGIWTDALSFGIESEDIFRTYQDVLTRNIGGSEGAVWVDEHRGIYVSGCCSPRMIDGFYIAQQNITSQTKSGFRVNMLLTGETEDACIRSDDPEFGRVAITTKKAGTVEIQMPDWLEESDIMQVNRPYRFINGCIVTEHLQPDDQVNIDYKLRETSINETISEDEYIITYRGNTVVKIEGLWPRPLLQIPIYIRKVK